jgi:hypothetical protein
MNDLQPDDWTDGVCCLQSAVDKAVDNELGKECEWSNWNPVPRWSNDEVTRSLSATAKTNSRLWRESVHAAALPGCGHWNFDSVSEGTSPRPLFAASSLHLCPASSLHPIALSVLEASCRSAPLYLVISSLYSNQWSLLPGDCGTDSGLLDRAPDFFTGLLPRRQQLLWTATTRTAARY